MAWFDDWVKGKQAETVMVTPEDSKGKVPAPKYRTMQAILDQYDTGVVSGEMHEAIETARQEVDMAMESFVATMEPEF